MARPEKEGIDYFPFNVDFFDDKENIKPVISRFGADGITLLMYLYCDIYKNGFYSNINDDFYYVASMDLRMKCDKIRQILNYFLERSLFDNTLFQSVKVLTAPGIQRRYQLAIRERVRKRKSPVIVDKNIWLIPEDEIEEVSVKVENVSTLIKVISFSDNPRKNEVIPRKNELNPCNNQQSKVKESKYIYKAIMDHFNSRCGTRYLYNSPETIQLIDTKLNMGFQEPDFIKVIDTKANEWIGTEREKYLTPSTLFGSKFENYVNQKPIAPKAEKVKQNTNNKFCSFPQRSYTGKYYSELESRLLKKQSM